MPELPEIVALERAFRDRARGSQVAAVSLTELSALKTFDPPLSALAGGTLVDVEHRGKFLAFLFTTTDGEPVYLAVHLSLGGWIRWSENPRTTPPKPGKGPLALRIRLTTESGDDASIDITEAGTRKRLSLLLVRDLAEVPRIVDLGLDPLASEFTATEFAELLSAAGKRRLKGLLRDQSQIAGIGNAWSDEILHAAKLSPYKPASSLTDSDVDVLHQAIVITLTEAVEQARGTAPELLKAEKRAALNVHGSAGEPCPVCGDRIREVALSDSSFQYCGHMSDGRQAPSRRSDVSRLLR